MVELGIERQPSDGQKDECDVGIHDEGQDALLERHIKRPDGFVRQIERDRLPVETFDGFALHLLQQVLLAGRHVVNQLLGERFLVGKGLRLAHRALGHFDIASALGDHGAHQRGGVILHLLFHDVVHLAAAQRDRMGRTGVGPGSHGRDVRAFQDEEPGRRCPAAAGRDVNDYRNRRGQNFLDDVAGGFQQAAGRIQLDQQRLVFVAIGLGQSAFDVLLGDGMNGVVDDNLQHFGGGGN